MIKKTKGNQHLSKKRSTLRSKNRRTKRMMCLRRKRFGTMANPF